MVADAAAPTEWKFFRFGLIVTGDGERDFLSLLLRSLCSWQSGQCTFQVIRRVNQRNPIISSKHKLKMVNTGKTIPDKDAMEIGVWARAYLEDADTFVLMVDDLEYARAGQADAVFQRYRTALDSMLGIKKNRASVQFLVNMLEAYYFGDAAAINTVLGTDFQDFANDVESIQHPKGKLKELARVGGTSFDEVEQGREIMKCLNVPHVLSNPATCRSLRTLFGWCMRAMEREFADEYQLRNGSYYDVTVGQIDALP